MVGHTLNHFFPWQVNEDGTEEETLNHIGRHELHDYFDRSLRGDPNVEEFYAPVAPARANPNEIENMLQIDEDPLRPGVYFGTDAPEFYTHAAGQIISLEGPPSLSADRMAVTYVTHRLTHTTTANPGPSHSGLYRNPLPLSDGTLVAVHTPETRRDRNEGTRRAPRSRYDFRLKTLKRQLDGYWVADQPLTAGLSKLVTYWDPDVLVTYDGPLWELDPVEVRPRARPPRRVPLLEAPELQVFAQENVQLSALKSYLVAHDLALVVSHDVTTRDEADRQQPFNLRVAGTPTQTVGTPGKVYDVALLQFFQADQIRGVGGTASPYPGRRVLAQPLHTPGLPNPPNGSGVPGSVVLGSDGSMAAFVPARRALAWQLTDTAGTPVVRERYWLTFQPGEIRVCKSCHGVNQRDQAGRPPPDNAPEALVSLLGYWKQATGDLDGDGLPSDWEQQFGLDMSSGIGDHGPDGDPDGDGKSNAEEYAEGTHPRGFHTRHFAEGATNGFFDTTMALANPDPDATSTVLLRFLRADGVVTSQVVTVPPLTRVTIDPEAISALSSAEFSTIAESDRLVVMDRTMSWDDAGYGSHAESDLEAAASVWYLAEGATHSNFDLYYLLQNPSPVPATVEIDYLRPAPAPPIVKGYTLGPASRRTIRVNDESPGLASTDVSGIVTSTDGVPIIVERAMYLNAPGRPFEAGHASAGLPVASTTWYLAEGATGDYFDMFVLLANPTTSDALVELRYLLPDGSVLTRTRVVPRLSRVTVWVDREDPRLADTAVSTTVTSLNGVPMLAERTMWWPGPTAASWHEAHASAGATDTGTRWALAAGELGGAGAVETYYLVANASALSASVDVTLLFEDGTTSARAFTVAPNSRFNVAVGSEFPEAAGRRFGAVVESRGNPPAAIVVERAMYSNADGIVWAAGTNALATRLN